MLLLRLSVYYDPLSGSLMTIFLTNTTIITAAGVIDAALDKRLPLLSVTSMVIYFLHIPLDFPTAIILIHFDSIR